MTVPPQTDDPGNTDDLAPLREEIDAIDHRIVALLAERQRVVSQVVTIKKTRNLPVFHPAREENLISDRRRQGEAAGIDPDFLEEVFRRILRESRKTQTAKLARKGVRAGAAVLIVGGSGVMGRYFARWFAEAGYEVRILDREDWDRARDLCAGIDLAILSVPIDLTAEVAGRLAPHLPAEAVLADITSLKTAPLAAMMAAHPGPVMGTHPLFGPTTSTLDKQIVVVTPGRDEDACQWVLDQLTAWGSILLKAGAEEHDEMMGIVQTLRHFATFAIGQFLARRRVNLQRTLEFSSPIYRLEIGMVGRLFAQDPALYAEIIFASPERRCLLRDYLDSLERNRAILDAGDKETFLAEFREIAEWFGPFSEQALRESSFLIDKLIERF